MKLCNTKDAQQLYWHCFVYGPPKTGKTTFCSTLPKPLLVSVDEDGMTSLRHKDIAFVEALQWLDLQNLLTTLERTVKDGSFTFEGRVFNSVAFDPINMMQTLLHKTYTVEGKTLSLPNRGAANDKLTNFVRRAFRLKCHVIFTAIERLDKDELTGRVKAGMDLSPALMRSFPAISSFNFHTVVEPQGGGKLKYMISTGTEGYYEAGGRYADKQVPLRVEANFEKLYNYVCGS